MPSLTKYYYRSTFYFSRSLLQATNVTKGDSDMIERFDIEKNARKIIIATLKLVGEEKKIHDDTNFVSDFGLENGDQARLFGAFDKKFGTKITDDDGIVTFKDLIETIVRQKLKKK